MIKNLSKYYENYIIILISLYPLLLVTGPALPEVNLLILSILLFNYVKKNFLKNYYENKIIFKYFAIFYLIIVISSINSFNLSSLVSGTSYLRFFFLTLVIYNALVLYDKKIFQYSFYVILFIFLILFLDSLLIKTGSSFSFSSSILNRYNYDNFRVSSFFGKEQIMGSYVARIFPVFIAFGLYLNFLKKAYQVSILFFIALILVLLSAERTSLFILSFSFLGIILFFKMYKKLFFLLLVVSLMILTLFLSKSFFKESFYRLFDHTYNQVFSKGKNLLIFSQRHQDHYFTAYKIFLDHKLIGSGPRMFRVECSKSKYAEPIKQREIDNANRFYAKNDGKIFNIKEEQKEKLAEIIYKNNEKDYFKFGDRDVLYFHKDQFFKKGDILVLYTPMYLSGCNTHPHNIALQLLSETGLVGFILFLIFYFSVLLSLFKMIINLKSKITDFNIELSKIFLLIFLVANFFPLIPSGNFFNNWMNYVFYFPIPFYLYLANHRK